MKLSLNSTAISIFLILLSTKAFAISPMSEKQLKTQTGQSGISIAIDDVVIYHQSSSIKFIDSNLDTPGYLGFKDIKKLHTYNTGNAIELDSDHLMGHISMDLIIPDASTGGYLNPYLSLSCSDWQSTAFFKADQIDFNGTDIGGISIVNSKFPKWNLYLGSHDSGIDFEAGFQMQTDSFKYDYGDPLDDNCLEFKNISIAGTFNNQSNTDDPANPSTWNPVDRFMVGNFKTNTPAKFDIGIRQSDNMPIIQISAPMSGSIRIENINIGQRDFGPTAIDGIQVHRMTIELPGRGLGQS